MDSKFHKKCFDCVVISVLYEIMIETVDNPSNAAEWAMAEMINQTDLLAKACEELDRVVG